MDKSLIPELLKEGLSIQHKTSGICMKPLILNGDMVTIQPWDKSLHSLKGKIALIKGEDQKLFLHRVIRTEGKSIITKADNYFTEDKPVSPYDILGIVNRIHVNPVILAARHVVRILKLPKFMIFKAYTKFTYRNDQSR